MRPVFCRSMKQLQVSDSDDSSAATCRLNLEDPSWLIADSYKSWKPQILHQAFHAGKKSQHIHENTQKYRESCWITSEISSGFTNTTNPCRPKTEIQGLTREFPRPQRRHSNGTPCLFRSSTASLRACFDESGASSAMQQAM